MNPQEPQTLEEMIEQKVQEFNGLFPIASARLSDPTTTRSTDPDVADNDAIWFHDWLSLALHSIAEATIANGRLEKITHAGADEFYWNDAVDEADRKAAHWLGTN